MKRIAVLIFLLSVGSPILAQEHKKNKSENHKLELHNFLGVFVGNTIIVQTAFQMPTIGVEYVREITPRVGVGFTAEIEIGSHIIQKNETGHVISEVKRQGAVLLIPSVFVRVYKELILTIGYGIEFERNENLAMSKIGLEYKLKMHNPHWFVLPSVSWDHTKLFDGAVYGVTFGCSF